MVTIPTNWRAFEDMESLDFSEDEIEHQLALLGYNNIPKRRLQEFKQDLDQLIRHERSQSQSSSEWNSPRSQSEVSRNSPTGVAVVREKLSVQKEPDLSIRMTPQARSFQQERLVLRSTYGANNFNVRPEHYDPYIQYSMSTKRPQTSPALHRMEADDSENGHNSTFNTSKSSCPQTEFGNAGRPVIKRKVLRKQSGQLQVCDESIQNDDTDDRLEDELERLQVSVSDSEQLDLEPDSQKSDSFGEATNAFQVYSKGMPRSHSENDIQTHPKSFIRPQSEHPHTKNLKKTDPVAKYFQYKQDWETFRPPGERDRKRLRWEIREQMMYKGQPSKKPPIQLPNTYVVPTEKKRSALRWEVRHYLANGIPPPRIYPL
ncbi:hypothetical protein AGOR_G00096150 [Albula goreensis]|uniref:Centriolar and ciliogenesis-associated protein HYLS1 C-terminal domain-containing protein n=1 Tax=Albula goreensis TaxID=1534307 RepID=A0A8T3DJE0_9TELE|nr:hypothetical protein AGOR_G00096150 [Albula goreensis]